MAEQKDPILTIEKFYEKTLELNEIYRHNVEAMNKDFLGKQQALFNRLSEEDRAEVVRREKQKLQDSVSKLVDRSGRPITTH